MIPVASYFLKPAAVMVRLIRARRNSADQVIAAAVRDGRPIDAMLGIADRHLRAGNGSAGLVGDGAGDGGSVLSKQTKRKGS